jgi:hypothetical protein
VAELPNLPTRIARLRKDMDPQFARAPEFGPDWFVIGPASKVVPGTRVEVPRVSKHDVAVVEVAEVVAEHVVKHRPESRYGTGDVRYVLASIVRPPDQPPRVPASRRPGRGWY